MDPTSNTINADAAREPRIVALRSRVHGLLTPVLGLVFDAMTDHLFNQSASSQLSPEGRSQCFEGFATLKAQSKALAASMLQEIDLSYGHLVELKRNEQASAPAELDLVDLEEFENNLAIDRIVRAGSERYWVALEAMTLRLAEVLGQDPKRIRLPFGLRGLCTAYRKAIKPLEFSALIVSELDKAFARNLLPEVGELYKQINQQLSAEGVLPAVEQELETTGSKLNEPAAERSPAQPQRAEPNPQPYPQAGQQTGIAGAGLASGPAAAVQGQPVGATSTEGGLRQGSGLNQTSTPAAAGAQQGLQQGPYLSDMGGANDPSPLQSSPARESSGSSFLESAAPLVAPSPLDEIASEAGISDFLPGRGSQALNTTVDAGVLDRVRTGFGVANDGVEPLSPTELTAQAEVLANEIGNLRQQGVRASRDGQTLAEQLGLERLGPEAEALRGSVALVDNLYQTMLDTLPLSEGMSDSLHSLKLPLAQLSVSDPDFYRNREHPARLLVERLSEVSALAPRNNPRVEKRIDEVLAQVDAEYDGDLSVFDRALTQVTDLALTMLRQQQRNIQRQVAAEEGKEKRQRASKDVEDALVTAMPDTALPASVQALVQKLLRDELTLRLLRDGDDERYRQLIDHLAETNRSLLSIAQGGQPLSADEAAQRVHTLRAQLDNAQFLTPEQDALLSRLENELAGNALVDLLDSQLGDHELFAEPAFSDRLQKLPRLHRWVKRARDLALNTWVAETLDDGSVRNLQLIWRNENGTRFAFANEQGHKVRDVDLIELARWLASRLRPLAPSEQLSIIEKSVFQTLERTQADLASVARPVVDGDLTQAELIDRTQSMMRRARRRGASHCALAVHTDSPVGTDPIQQVLAAAGLDIEAAGQLSPSTRGLIVASASVETLQTAVRDGLAGADATGVGMALIDPTQGSAEELWRVVEETAKRGLSLSPNTGVVAERETRPTDLAGAVRKTYARLRDDMPPRLSFRRIKRTGAAKSGINDELFQVLLDGSANAGGDLVQQSGYHSTALSIALDCAKVNAVCQYAERLTAQGREVPVFSVRISTDGSTHNEFLDFVLNEVSESGIGTDRLCIELRDSTRLREASRAADFAQTLRSIGCQIAISDVNPSRGSTSQLQTLGPHLLALDDSLWPPKENDGHLPALHQAISDLHHLVGEHVVLRNPSSTERAPELGIDFIETLDAAEISPDDLVGALPALQR